MNFEYLRAINIDNDTLNTQGSFGWELVNVLTVPEIVTLPSDLLGIGTEGDAVVANPIVFYFRRPAVPPV